MTDLEIIKKQANKINLSIGTFIIGEQSINEIMRKICLAATRMSERIVELEKEIQIKEEERIGAMNAANKWYNDYNELKSELAAAKPITCGECKLWHKFQCNFAYDDENLKATDFCSKAVRKEAASGSK